MPVVVTRTLEEIASSGKKQSRMPLLKYRILWHTSRSPKMVVLTRC